MNTFTVLFGILLCLAVVNGRHYSDRNEGTSEEDEQIDSVRRQRDHGASQMRHRRRRWQMNYGYDYPQPSSPYYPDRREYDRNQDLLSQIYKLLDEIATNSKRPTPPPPPPQPIYIPYPVPYPVPQQCSCPKQGSKNPQVNSRFPEMDDVNQNWGFYINNQNTDDGDDGSDGSRPISFVPIRPLRPSKQPAPPVEHGTNQFSNNQVTTKAPKTADAEASLKLPGMCNAAVLSCCGLAEGKQEQCFTNVGCGVNYVKGETCNENAISSALDSFKNAYQPIR